MVQITIAPGKEPMPPIHDDRNGIKVTLGCYVMLATDANGRPGGIKAIGQGRIVEVNLDRVQLKAFAEMILKALQR